nr:uncharacterized protein LOC118680478 isoform X1 [Bactrocera oleae]
MYFVLLYLFIIFNIHQIFCYDPLDIFKEMGRLTQTCLDLTCTNLNDLKVANELESDHRKDVNCLRMCLFLHARENVHTSNSKGPFKFAGNEYYNNTPHDDEVSTRTLAGDANT